MRKALQILGYNETYHGFAPAFETPLDNKMWLDAANAKFKGKGKPFGRKEFDQLLGHCQVWICASHLLSVIVYDVSSVALNETRADRVCHGLTTGRHRCTSDVFRARADRSIPGSESHSDSEGCR